MGSSGAMPKILLAKPGVSVSASASLEEAATIRGVGAGVGGPVNLNVLSESGDFQFDRFLPFLTDNTEFTVVGVIGPQCVGKSTLLNYLYSFHPNSSPALLPPFPTHSQQTIAAARHSTLGIQPHVSSNRFILLDTQPLFSPSVLADRTRPDAPSTFSTELAHQLLGIQVGVLLASVCHILIVVSEGARDPNMWHFISTVDLLKHGIPDPSLVTLHSHSSNLGSDKDKLQEDVEEYIATPLFVHTNLREEDLSLQISDQMEKVLAQYFRSSSFVRPRNKISAYNFSGSKFALGPDNDSRKLDLFVVPKRVNSLECQYESYDTAMWKIRDHVLSMTRPSFSRTLSEREWLKNTGKVWEMVKNSSIIAEYGRMLQSSGLFRR